MRDETIGSAEGVGSCDDRGLIDCGREGVEGMNAEFVDVEQP